MYKQNKFSEYLHLPRRDVIVAFALVFIAVATYGAISGEKAEMSSFCQHGWPWGFVVRHIGFDDNGTEHTRSVDEFSPFMMLANLGMAVLIAACAALLWHVHRASGLKPCQFSLKEVLSSLAVLSVLLCFWRMSHVQYDKERQVVAELSGIGWVVHGENVCILPNSVVRLFRDFHVPFPRCFWRVGAITWDEQAQEYEEPTSNRAQRRNVDEMLREVAPKLRVLRSCDAVGVHDVELTDVGVNALASGLPDCSEADFERSPNIGDAGVSAIVAHWRRMKSLSLAGKGISDEGIRCLTRLRNLEWLTLIDTSISDEGVGQLRRLPKLRWLKLMGADLISSDGRRQVAALANLSFLEVPDSWANDELFDQIILERNIGLCLSCDESGVIRPEN